MKRISTSTKVIDKFGAGKHGYTDGNAATGIPPTDLEADLFDHIQEELCTVVESVGGAVAGDAHDQLYKAILSIIAANGSAPGNVIFVAKSTAPSGYLKANGAVVSRTTYAALFAAIGTTFNTGGEAATDFRLPDLRGEFLRGWDDGKGIDAARVFGSSQTDAFQGHKHSYESSNVTGADFSKIPSGGGVVGTTAGVNPPVTDSVNGAPRTAAETRPRNIALLACIKY